MSTQVQVAADPTPAEKPTTVQLKWCVPISVNDAKTLENVAVDDFSRNLSARLGHLATKALREIGLLVMTGGTRNATWNIDRSVAEQCQFKLHPARTIHGTISICPVEGVQIVPVIQWLEDLQLISQGKIPGAKKKPAVLAAAVPSSVPAKVEQAPVAPSQILPVQYGLLGRSAESMTDQELEEGMLAALAIAANVKSKHQEFVDQKKRRLLAKIELQRAELERMRTREEELRTSLAELQGSLTAIQESTSN